MPSYRYTLTVEWDKHLPRICWVCLNPSTADGGFRHVDPDNLGPEEDHTTKKILGFSRRWGFGSYTLVNLFPVRATDQKDLWGMSQSDRGGDSDRNVGAVNDAIAESNAVILAWGTTMGSVARQWVAAQMIARVRWRTTPSEGNSIPVWCLGRTKNGQPQHPARVGYATERYNWFGDITTPVR